MVSTMDKTFFFEREIAIRLWSSLNILTVIVLLPIMSTVATSKKKKA